MLRNRMVIGIVFLTLVPGVCTQLHADASDPPQLTARPTEMSGGAQLSLQPQEASPRSQGRRSKSSYRPPQAEGLVLGTAFEAYHYDDNATETGSVFIPPDPIGAVGTDRVIAVVNVGIEARDRLGALLWRDALRDFFAPLGGLTLGTFTFDPKIIYDRYEDRFVVVALEATDLLLGDPSDESRILLAVSKTPTPSSPTAADWNYHAVDAKLVIGGVPSMADYPGFEADEEVLYITANMFSFFSFGGSRTGVRLWIVDKGVAGGFYGGGPAVVTVHDPIPSGFLEMTTMPAQVFGAGGVGSGIGTFLVGYSSLTFGGPGADEAVQVIRVDDPLGVGGGPFFIGDTVIIGDIEDVGGVFGFPPLPNAPQSGSPALIEVNDSRALDAVWRDDSLWLTTTIKPNAGPDAATTTAHWFKLDTSAVPGGAVVLSQQGNIGGEDIAPETYTFFPSVAVNSTGDAKFGFSASAASIFAGAFVTGHKAGDAPGTVRTSGTVHVGEDFYLRTFGGSRNRWGDYSGIALDPTDDRVFWVFNEYAKLRGTPSGGEDGRWGTAWASCAFPCVSVSCNMDLIVRNGSNITLDYCITNCGALAGDFDYTISDDAGWCTGSAGTVTLVPGATTCITINCSVPQAAVAGDTNFVHFSAAPVGCLADSDSCQTKLTVDEPVPVVIEGFEAVSTSEGVLLSWRVSAETQRDLLGVRVHRADGKEGPYEELTTAALEPAAVMSFRDPEVEPGRTYWYRLFVLSADGTASAVGPIRVTAAHRLGQRTALHTPFAPAGGGPVEIRYGIERSSAPVRLEIFDVRGRRIRMLGQAVRASGEYLQTWDRRDDTGRRTPRGVYLVHLTADGVQMTKKLVLVRD